MRLTPFHIPHLLQINYTTTIKIHHFFNDFDSKSARKVFLPPGLCHRSSLKRAIFSEPTLCSCGSLCGWLPACALSRHDVMCVLSYMVWSRWSYRKKMKTSLLNAAVHKCMRNRKFDRSKTRNNSLCSTVAPLFSQALTSLGNHVFCSSLAPAAGSCMRLQEKWKSTQ